MYSGTISINERMVVTRKNSLLINERSGTVYYKVVMQNVLNTRVKSANRHKYEARRTSILKTKQVCKSSSLYKGQFRIERKEKRN